MCIMEAIDEFMIKMATIWMVKFDLYVTTSVSEPSMLILISYESNCIS